MRLLYSLLAFAIAVTGVTALAQTRQARQAPSLPAQPPKLKILFLGDNAGHKPAERFQILQPVFAARNIELTYTDKLTDLNAQNLSRFDGLLIYANHTRISPEQEKALLAYVESGKGFIPIHCASYCFLNSPRYVELVGAQFRSHETGTFRVEDVKPDHPIMRGYQSFSSWDETYVHTKHNEKDRTVLEVRVQGELKEPWTWVRTPGKARVFYTAWGHDQRTWSNPGFHNLLERGVRWACGQDPALAGVFVDRPKMTELRKDVKPFEYTEAKIPFYPPSKQWGKQAEPITKMQKPLSVDESLKHIVTPVDFEVKVFVTEEKLGGKPIAMNWDEQGRLWVSITADYPNNQQPEGRGNDRIVICEDTDGDGVCDQVTTFADKLSIPTSLLPYAGGVIVHQAPATLFLKDTDGDGRADVRQELFRGWGTSDTHAGPSNLHYGFDNWIYGSVGYAGFRGEVNGEQLSFRQGFYRFKVEAERAPSPQPPPPGVEGGRKTKLPLPPRGKGAGGLGHSLKVTKLEFLRSTNNNTWGLCFNEAGELFGSTANGCPIVHMPIPNRYYEKVRGLTPSVLQNIAPDNHFEPITDKVRQVDWHGGFTAASNIAVYTARTYPREYWNTAAFISEPTGHLTATMMLSPDGASYRARYGWNLVASDDEWCAPIDAQVGPDGHMWVIDWYAFIVQHNPTPAGFRTGKGQAYETPLRDKTHGRIYRVVYTKAKPEKPFTLKDATPEKLVETLKHPNMTWRLHAQRLLVQRGKADVVGELRLQLGKGIGADQAELDPSMIHTMWAIEGLHGYSDNGLASDALMVVTDGTMSQNAAIRRNAAAVLAGEFVKKTGGTALPYESLMSDPDATSRLAKLLCVTEEPSERDPGSLLFFSYCLRMEKGKQREWWKGLNTIDSAEWDALVIAASAHYRSFLAVYCLVGREEISIPERVIRLAEVTSRNLASRGSAADLDYLFKSIDLLSGAKHESLAEPIIAGLASAWPSGKAAKLNAESENTIGRLLTKLPAAARGKLLKLASTWGVKGLDAQLAAITKAALSTLADAKATVSDRLAAAQQIIEFRPESDEAATAIVDAITPQTSPLLVDGLLEALGQSKAKGVGIAVVGKLKELPPEARSKALALVLARTESARAFLDAVEKGTLRFDLLALDQRTALATHPNRELAERAKKLLALGGGLPSPDRQKVIEELRSILARTGDASNGKKVFTQHCAKCHKHGGEGTQIGPDLSGFAVHPKEEILIHVLDPSRSVEGNFKAYRVVTTDDRTLIGILGATTATSVEVIDGDAKRHALSKDEIASLKETDKSLMPEGFEKVMKPAELTDLLEFLTQKGKFVPLPLDRVATVVSTKDMFFDRGGAAERLIFPDWKPKMVGEVPFVLVDPEKDTKKNVVMLYGPQGNVPPKMPKSVSLPFGGKSKAIHLLSGVGGWSAQQPMRNGTVSMIVRLTYDDGKTEDHELKNGVHFADYIGRFDVPESKFAFALRGQQIRYLAVTPKRPDVVVKTIELVKGPDRTAPVVMAVTVESP